MIRTRSAIFFAWTVTLASNHVWAAPPERYGGSLGAYIFGPIPSLNPGRIDSAADATLQAALFEPLFRSTPNGDTAAHLAEGPLQWFGDRTVLLTLKPNIRRHDGLELDAEGVVAWFHRLSQPGSRAGFLALPIEGGRGRLRGTKGRLAVRAVGPYSVEVKLAYRYPFLEALWASPEAGVAIPVENRTLVGTGPFTPDARDPLRVVAFPQHREGRPFLDAIEVRPIGSSLGIQSLAERGNVGLVFGTYQQSCRGNVYLALALHDGDSSLRGTVDAAINRKRLTRRFLPPGALPVRSFLGLKALAPAPRTSLRGPVNLWVPRGIPGGTDLAKRIQLDLLRAGVRATIQHRLPDRTQIPGGSRSSLSLDHLLVDESVGGPAGRFHALLALASRFARSTDIPEGRMESFARASPDQRPKIVEQLEADLRAILNLVPIARLQAGPNVPEGLMDAKLKDSCAVELANARWKSEPPR